MASIYLDKRTGMWIINYVDLNGKRIRKSLGTKDKKLAELKLKEVELELAKGRLGFTINISLGDFIEKYLEFSKAVKSKNSYLTDRKACRDLLDYFGAKVKLSQITLQKLEGFKISLLEKYSKVTANIRIRHIKAMFNKAVEWQFLSLSPAEKLKQFRAPLGKPDFLTVDQINKLFSSIDNKEHLAIFKLLFYTGVRISEAINLSWEDIDFENKTIIVRAYNSKNYKERHIPIHTDLLPFLQELKNLSPDKPVRIAYSSVEKLFSKYSKKSGIKATPHLLRHSIATALASNGTPIQVIQKILGHSNVSTTMIYAKLTDEYIRKNLDSINVSKTSA